MYYVIETKYVGPNQDQKVDSTTIEISTSPATTNTSHEVKLHGWCGTSNDWAVYAHGEYPTAREAEAAIHAKFGPVRSDDDYQSEPGVIAAYRVGEYVPMSSENTADWIYELMRVDVDADTTDERIAELVASYEKLANAEGYALDSDADDHMKAFRQELRDELAD